MTIENGRLRLCIDPSTGTIAELYDKSAEIHVLAGPGARPVVMADPSDTWSHDVLRFEDEVGQFTPTRVTLVEQGPVRATIHVEGAYGRSTLLQEFSLYACDPEATGTPTRVEVRVEVDWREHHKLLKLIFPVNLSMAEVTAEIPYGHLARTADGAEEPVQRWLDISGPVRGPGTLYGLSLMSDAKASYSATRKELRLTILRSPIAAHHDPAVPDPDRHYTYLDQGVQTFRYSLFPHQGTWKHAQTVRHTAEHCARPTVVLETFHPGPLPQTNSFLAIESGTVALGALKRAEDGTGTILRLYETDRTATTARVAMTAWGRVSEERFAPGRIKTVLAADNAEAPIRDVNLLERSGV
ncbi:MAG: hypothetical protein M3N68_02380 [Actinomycetota bacterium]|nr:hypothetical protein [Actinomycetota bacterium]